MKFLTKEQRREIAIDITNRLVELGLVKDCTDTDDESEFEAQDAIREILRKHKI